MKSFDTLILERTDEGRTCIVRLNRPERQNTSTRRVTVSPVASPSAAAYTASCLWYSPIICSEGSASVL